MNSFARIGSPFLFLVITAGVYGTALYVRGLLGWIDSPGVLAAAVAADIVVLVPVAYYFLVVRRLGLPIVSVAAIFVLSLIAATNIIPSKYGSILTPLEIVAVVAEISILGFIAWKSVRGVRRIRTATSRRNDEDAFSAIRGASREVIASERLAEILAWEMAMIYYGVLSWRQRPHRGVGSFTSYERSSYKSILTGIGVLLVVELIGVHVLVQHYWSTAGACVLSLITAYSGVWLLSEWHAHRLRPSLITTDTVILRAGIRWEVEIPLLSVQSFRRISAVEEKPRGVLNLAVAGDAEFEVVTDTPVAARGMYGRTKSVTRVWFTVDTPDEFEEMLSHR